MQSGTIIQIHGNDYMTVAGRVGEFHKLYPKGSIETELKDAQNERYIVKAVVNTGDDRVFTGYAEEHHTTSGVNETSPLENAETSAVGRALGFLNIGNTGSIASADEVTTAISQQTNGNGAVNNTPVERLDNPEIIPTGKYKGMGWGNVDDSYLKWASEECKNPAMKEGARQEIERRYQQQQEAVTVANEDIPF